MVWKRIHAVFLGLLLVVIAPALFWATQIFPAPSSASAPGLDTVMSCCKTPSVV